MTGLNTISNSKQISYTTKLNVLKTCVLSTALYACETWTIKKTDKDKIWPLKRTAIEEYYI